MGNICVTVKSVRSYLRDDVTRYRVTFNEKFDGITKDDAGEFVVGQVDYIDFRPSQLKAQIIDLNEGLEFIYNKRREKSSGFDAADYSLLLKNAKLTINRTPFVAGEEYIRYDGEKVTHEFDGFRKEIVEFELSEFSAQIINNALLSSYSF